LGGKGRGWIFTYIEIDKPQLRKSLFKEDFREIGFSMKPFKVDGFLKIEVEEMYFDALENSSHVFFLIDGQHIPFRIKELNESPYLMVKLEKFDSSERVEALTNKKIFLPNNECPVIDELKMLEKLDIPAWIGFDIYDNNAKIGTIIDIVEMPGQLMAFVKFQEKEVMIPLNESFIYEIDSQKKRIFANLPEGLMKL